jgi:cytidine deaminase
MNESTIKMLIDRAIQARQASYSPYSRFKVGAALLTDKGEIFEGCNIEIGGLASTCCAERTAFFKAISQNIHKFAAIAIVGGPEDILVSDCYPCGVCRQVMAEFCPGDFVVIVAESADKWQKFSLDDLLPYRFAEKTAT